MSDPLHLDRRQLTDPAGIVDRMARDILDARRGGQYGLVDLTESGWTQAQAMRWSVGAHDLAASPAFRAQVEVERLRWLQPTPRPVPTAPVGAEMTEVVEASRSADARPGALALCVMRPLG